MQWTYNGKEIDAAPEDSFGFIYLITNCLSGRMYVGRKQLWFKRTKKIKGRKNRKHFTVESDWRKYWGSCDELKADIETLGVENFTRQILRFCGSKKDLSYFETEELFKREVLKHYVDGARLYYNGNIMGKFFSHPEDFVVS